MTVALLYDDIRQANFATKPCFENADLKFEWRKILKAAKLKRILLRKQHEYIKAFSLISQTAGNTNISMGSTVHFSATLVAWKMLGWTRNGIID